MSCNKLDRFIAQKFSYFSRNPGLELNIYMYQAQHRHMYISTGSVVLCVNLVHVSNMNSNSLFSPETVFRYSVSRFSPPGTYRTMTPPGVSPVHSNR